MFAKLDVERFGGSTEKRMVMDGSIFIDLPLIKIPTLYE